MPITLREVKERLDSIISKARVDLYKPIQIAEVLQRSRVYGDIDPLNRTTYQNRSLRWRDDVTLRLLGKRSTSSARYQHDVWNETAMPPEWLRVLDEENKHTKGAVEHYVYRRFVERQETVAGIVSTLQVATPKDFDLRALLQYFHRQPGIRRSIDKAYEIVTHSLFETIVTQLKATVKVSVPAASADLLAEFADLAGVLLGLRPGRMDWELPAHIYRVGVTNAADRGLDMWANFGPAIQVKHLSLDEKLAQEITDQVESERIVIVCRDADAGVINTVTKQISWGRRVCGIVPESKLVEWYDRCLRGKFSSQLGEPLLSQLSKGFKEEFPQTATTKDFLEDRGYLSLTPPTLWLTPTEAALGASKR